METKHTPTPWTFEGLGDTFGIRDKYDSLILEIPYDESDGPGVDPLDTRNGGLVKQIVRAVNSHAALTELAESINAHDEFTYATDTPLPVRQICALINIWRGQAADALRLAKES